MEIEKILDGYTDIELAFLFKYKINSYLPNTKDKIIDYIKKRGISEESINIITKKKKLSIENKQSCPRCGSTKIQVYSMPKVNTTNIEALDGLFGKQLIINKLICDVCGFEFNNDNKINPLFSHLRTILSKILSHLHYK